MSKIDLDLNFAEIRRRIEEEKGQTKPLVWATKVGVKKNVVTNVHGKTQQKPSLEYIVAVARATFKPIEWYLYGSPASNLRVMDRGPEYRIDRHQCALCDGMSDEIKELCKKVKGIVESGQKVVVDALKSNIEAFQHSVKQAEKIEKLLDPDSPGGTGKDAGTVMPGKKM
jgi:hypothetical protein